MSGNFGNPEKYTIRYVVKVDRFRTDTVIRFEGEFDSAVDANNHAKNQARCLKKVLYKVVPLTPTIREIMESPPFRSLTP